jgi:hypothetical protein
MDKNGRLVTVLLMVCSLLSGVVVAGGGMMIRGDIHGVEAANAVEQRVNARMDEKLDTMEEFFLREVTHLRELMEKALESKDN